MKVSIITICYNSDQTIEDTIRSVLNQDYQNVEYLIIDGNSKDKTLQIIDKYANKITKTISEPDRGIYDAMNKGIENATGDVIGILNSDDVYAAETVISDVINLFQTSNCDATYADLVYVERENTDKITRYWKAKEYKKGMFLKGWMPPHPTFFVKKSIYDQFGLYNLALKSAADYEMMLRLIHRYNIKLAYLPRTIVKMRLGGESNVTLKNRIRANKEDRLAWKLNELEPNWLTLARKPLSKISQFLFRT